MNDVRPLKALAYARDALDFHNRTPEGRARKCLPNCVACDAIRMATAILAEAALHAGVPAAPQWPSVEQLAKLLYQIGYPLIGGAWHGDLATQFAQDILAALSQSDRERQP